MARSLPHLFVRESPKPEPYARHRQGMRIAAPPAPTSPRGHAAALTEALQAAEVAAANRRAAADITVAGSVPGLYVIFDGHPQFDLQLKSLEAQRSGIELVSVTKQDGVERATVFIPDGKVKYFIKRFEEYAT